MTQVKIESYATILLTVPYATEYSPTMQTSSERRQLNGEWVKALRKGLGLNQDEFAEQLGVSRSAVARWELNAFRPSKLAAKVLLDFAATHSAAQNAPADGQSSTLNGLRVRKPQRSQSRSGHDSRKQSPGQRKP